ncbi:hypothetical protein VR7878_00659 [Vibrio ruber DSM 16370]|uniref:Uncharacterized protein n=1 Tax=Vibrio ruber (strain DSM 16370 / JCM 11486 / BCRC 17186 / CECT 7878 / LMG 23124 / VR1) TaxID=1123498 RepID=A0A1R4LCQ4_VIBR1|nr:hypothetical protein [Vibrio ruber]SJN54173.1 hypothetical protein VR7878_00659 [Vibrio ruber DSM 16370]
MQFLKKLFAGHNTPVVTESEADAIHQAILQLEQQYAATPGDITLRQNLLVKYTQAASIYAQVPAYQNCVNDVFDKMNALRNTARKNF